MIRYFLYLKKNTLTLTMSDKTKEEMQNTTKNETEYWTNPFSDVWEPVDYNESDSQGED